MIAALLEDRDAWKEKAIGWAEAVEERDALRAKIEKLENPGDWWRCEACNDDFWVLNAALEDCAEIPCTKCKTVLTVHDHGCDGFELRA